MAEYSMKARIQLKYDSWENWTSINLGEDKGANLILKQGEIGICADPPRIDNAETQNSPCVMCKVGNGSSKFSELEWMSANAADVYSWAKKSGIVINKIGNGEIVGDISWDEETQALQATMAQLPEMGDIDATLTVEGAAADAKAVGDAFDALGILSTKDSVSKSDLASDVQTSLGKADTALQSFTETDPTVPAWAKASTKPNYTASEVGLGNVDNVKQYSASNPPPYPVESVNGKTGTVTVNEVPSCSTSDDGKFLRVVGGVAAWVSISNAEEAIF